METFEKTLPIVAVGISVYNAASYIEETLEALTRQDYAGKYYIVVSDDYSNDGTWEKVCAFAEQYPTNNWILTRHAKTHICGNQNNAIRSLPTEVEYYITNDADDISCPNRLSVLVNYFVQNPDVDLIASDVHFIIGRDYCTMPHSQKKEKRYDANVAHKMITQWGCTLAFTRKLWEAFPFADEYVDQNDLVWAFRARLLSTELSVPDRLLYYRLHDTQISNAANCAKMNRWNLFVQYRKDVNYAKKSRYITNIQYVRIMICVYRYGVAAMLNKFKLWRWVRDRRKK